MCMNIEEIKKSYQCCYEFGDDCANCPCGMRDPYECADNLIYQSIKIINEQQKEIDKLKQVYSTLLSNSQIEVSKKLESEIKQEGITEFLQYIGELYSKSISDK